MIPHQGEATAGELNPDLMAPAGVQADMDQGLFSLSQPPEFQSGFFDPFSLPFYHENLVFGAVLPQQIRPVAGFRRRTVNHGHIFFHHGSLLNRFAQCGGCGLRPGVDHDTPHIFIQPVNGKDLAPQCRRHIMLRIHPNGLDANNDILVGI